MEEKQKISVVINTYNASSTLGVVLDSVRGFDEVVVCDMESTDDTVAIARAAGARVVTFPKGNISIVEPARNFAIRSAANDWVLVVDADEIVPDAMRRCLYDILARPDHADAYFVPRKNLFMGEWIEASFPDWQLRFLRPTLTDWPPLVHAVPHVDGRVDHLPKDVAVAFVHLGDTLHSRIRKMNDYTDNELAKAGSGGRVSLAALWLKPWWRFFRYYVLRGAFLKGRMGYIRARLNYIYKFTALAKAYERERTRSAATAE